MTELETVIRDALHARAEAVEPREAAPRAPRPVRWLPPTIAAALVVGLVALTLVLVAGRDTKTRTATQKTASFVGYSWRLVQIDDRQGRLTLPASTKASVGFGQHGTLTGDDTVHSLQVSYRVAATGYRPTGPVMESGNGLGGSITVALKRTLFAIGSCFSSVRGGDKPPVTTTIRAAVTGNRLVLHTTDGVLTFVRSGVVRELHG